LSVERISPGSHSGVQLEARAAQRNQALRQLYIVRSVGAPADPKQAVVITLTTPLGDLAAASGPFDWVLAHLTFEAPIRPDAKSETKSETKPDAGR
jgi:hypothetical protein